MRNKTEGLYIRLSENERKLIEEKMKLCNMENMSAYILKMAIDGMVINLSVPELKEISSLLRYNGNNINQIAKRLNSSQNIYASDIKDIQEKQTQITEMVKDIFFKLAKL